MKKKKQELNLSQCEIYSNVRINKEKHVVLQQTKLNKHKILIRLQLTDYQVSQKQSNRTIKKDLGKNTIDIKKNK